MATPDRHHNVATGPEHLLQKGLGDLVAFGREFIADPDLVERIRRATPLNEQRRAGYYGDSAAGYTDYPTPQDLEAEEGKEQNYA